MNNGVHFASSIFPHTATSRCNDHEFTVPLQQVVFYLSLYDKEGRVQKSETVTLGNK